MPLPGPRPMRLREWVDPAAGLRLDKFMMNIVVISLCLLRSLSLFLPKKRTGIVEDLCYLKYTTFE